MLIMYRVIGKNKWSIFRISDGEETKLCSVRLLPKRQIEFHYGRPRARMTPSELSTVSGFVIGLKRTGKPFAVAA
jgi:hypothetical protein